MRTQAVYLEEKDVPEEWRRIFGYSGHKFKAYIHENREIEISDTDLDWSGGSRHQYCLIIDGKVAPLERVAAWPKVGYQVIPLGPAIVVEHSIFSGKDMGLTFHIAPAQVNQLRLPQEIPLLADEKAVLWVHCARKSHYNGQNRFQMLQEAQRWKGEPEISQEGWNAAVARLKELGMLNKAGAVTPKGRNAYQRDLYI